jgi:hypothetical protein
VDGLVARRRRAGLTIGDDTRSLQFKFEVFTLTIRSMEDQRARWAAWKPPQLPADVPEGWRKLFSTKPPIPEPPTVFTPWPFGTWRVDVLRRVEYIIEDVDVGPTVGDNPNMQAPARPGEVPAEAAAACDVGVGLLFTASDGGRLLIGVGWRPGDLVVTQEAKEVDEYLAPCQLLPVAEYLRTVHLGH